MKKPNIASLMILTAALLISLSFAEIASAQTRLFVPTINYNSREDTQLLAANNNDTDAQLDLWAFSAKGELIGQYQMMVKAHGTRSVTLGEAFLLGDRSVQGWLGAVSNAPGVQVSYSRIGDLTETFDATEWSARESLLTLTESGKGTVNFSNPNAFAATVTVQGVDSYGRVVGNQAVELAPFAQRAMPSSAFGNQAARLNVMANADIVTTIDETTLERIPGVRKFSTEDTVVDPMGLVIEGPEGIGAYQITLSFDPAAVQFSSKDIEAGVSEGFDTKPLVVNIDNVAGQITIASFQVGARPEGQSLVAKLNVTRRRGMSARFGIKIDEITNTEGKSLVGTGLSVGLVRVN